jgi:hypothetical protein
MTTKKQENNDPKRLVADTDIMIQRIAKTNAYDKQDLINHLKALRNYIRNST